MFIEFLEVFPRNPILEVLRATGGPHLIAVQERPQDRKACYIARPRSLYVPVARDLSCVGLCEYRIKDGLFRQAGRETPKATLPDQNKLLGTNRSIEGTVSSALIGQNSSHCAGHRVEGLRRLSMLATRPFSDDYPVFFTSICVYRSRARPIQTVATISSWARNPILFSALDVVVVGFVSVALKASESLSIVIEALACFRECHPTYAGRTLHAGLSRGLSRLIFDVHDTRRQHRTILKSFPKVSVVELGAVFFRDALPKSAVVLAPTHRDHATHLLVIGRQSPIARNKNQPDK